MKSHNNAPVIANKVPLATAAGQLGAEDGFEVFFASGEGTVERGPLEDGWQSLKVDATAMGDRRDPDNTRTGPEDMDELSIAIEGAFFRLRTWGKDGTERCPGDR